MNRNDLVTIGVMALVFCAVLAFIVGDGRAEITISVPRTKGEIDVGVHNRKQFKDGFGFSVRMDLNQLEGEKLLEEIKRLGLKTKSGELVKSFAVDKQRGLIIATTVPGTAELSLVRKESKELFLSARDEKGSFITLQPEQIGVFNFNGSHIGFEFKRFSELKDQRAYFVLLLDRSGSMSSVIGAVKQAASSFMMSLPANAYCRVLSFSHDLMQHTRNFMPCAQAAKELGSIKAGGGTNLYGALVAGYRDLAAITDSLKAVVLITDGVGDGGMTKQQVLQRKNAPTHTYFLGSYREQQLTGIADTFIYGDQDVRKLLGKFLEQLGDAVRNQAIITVKER